MIPPWKPEAISASGSLIDCLMKSASLPASSLSSSGPVADVVPASASVWQAPHAVAVPLPSAKSFLASIFGAAAAGGPGETGGAGSGSGSEPEETPAADGKMLFAEGNGTATACGACHTLADAATQSQTGPDLDMTLNGKDADFIREAIVNPSAEIAEGFQDIMPKDYGDTLSDEELDALVEYLGKVAGK